MVSCATKIGNRDLIAEVRWMPELDAAERLSGEYVLLKMGCFSDALITAKAAKGGL